MKVHFDKSDEDELVRICRIISPSVEDMDSIYNLYKKYINPNIDGYKSSGCNTCGNSIVNLWRGLSEWFNVNRNNL